MTFTQSIQGGVQEAWFMFYDSNGDPSGSTTVPLGNGQSSGAYKLIGIQNVPGSVPESTNVNVPGDDGNLGNIPFSSDAAREFILSFGLQDLDFEGWAQDTPVEQVGEIMMGVEDVSPLALATGALIVQSKAVKKNGAASGGAAWSGRIWPLAQLLPLGRETYAGRTAGVIRYKASLQPATNNAWGTTIVNKSGSPITAYSRRFDSDNPITMHAFRGALSSVTVDKTPKSVAKTSPFSDKVLLGVSGIVGRDVSLTPSVATGRPGLVLYEY